MPKWTYPLAFFFIVFLIYTDPSGAGQLAGQFASFAVRLLQGFGEFLTGLFQGASGDPDLLAPTSTTIAQLSPEPTFTTSTLPLGTEATAQLSGQSASVSGIITHSHELAPHVHTPTTLG